MIRHTATVVSISSGGHRARVLARRDKFFDEYFHLVRPIAERIAFNLPPSFDLEDLIQVGSLGLLQAATNYRPKEHNETPFDAYARPVIRGKILDSVRRRHYTENTRPSIDTPISIRTGHPEGDEEISTHGPIDRAESVEITIDRKRQRQHIERLSRAYLNDQQAAVMGAYYTPAQPSLAQVAARLGIAEWKAVRAHKEALEIFRGVLKAA